jgi:hypothetical protein
LRAKRRFLKENILDVYIREEELIDQFLDFFLLYLKNRKGIDTRDHNLELLSLPELKELVAEFRTLHPSAEQTSVLEVENSIDVSLSRISAEKQPQFDAHKVFYVFLERCSQMAAGTMNFKATRNANAPSHSSQSRTDITTTSSFSKSNFTFTQAGNQESGWFLRNRSQKRALDLV